MKLRVQVRTRRQWERFCLWGAVGGGCLAGIIWILPALSMALGVPTWSVAWHHDFQRAGDLLLMVVISNVARVPRQWLLWVFVPPAIWLVWSVLDRVVLGNWSGLVLDLHGNVPNAALDLVFGCLIALFLGRFGRGREEEDAVPDAASAMRFDSQEGVWPPAPNYPPQPLGQKEDGPHGK